jgi:hypothetical protein
MDLSWFVRLLMDAMPSSREDSLPSNEFMMPTCTSAVPQYYVCGLDTQACEAGSTQDFVPTCWSALATAGGCPAVPPPCSYPAANLPSLQSRGERKLGEPTGKQVELFLRRGTLSLGGPGGLPTRDDAAPGRGRGRQQIRC